MKGDVLYNAIIRAIEPDLLTCNLDTLDEKYKGESAEEHAARMQRYRDAFTRLDGVLKDVSEELAKDLQKMSKAARKSLHLKEEKERTEETERIEEMLSPPADSNT